MDEYKHEDMINDNVDSDLEELQFHHHWTEDGFMSKYVSTRMSIMEYDRSKMVYSKGPRIEPEIRHSSDSMQSTITRLYPHLYGYPVKINDQVLTLGRSIRSIQMMISLLEEIELTKRMWAPRDLQLELVINARVTTCYNRIPLYAFNKAKNTAEWKEAKGINKVS